MKYKQVRKAIAEAFERSRNPNYSGYVALKYLHACHRRGELSLRQEDLVRLRDAAFMQHICGYVAMKVQGVIDAANRMQKAFATAARNVQRFGYLANRMYHTQSEDVTNDRT